MGRSSSPAKEAKNSKVPKLTVAPCVHPHPQVQKLCRVVLCSVRRYGYRLHGGFTPFTPIVRVCRFWIRSRRWSSTKELSILTLSPLSKTPRARSPAAIRPFYWSESLRTESMGATPQSAGQEMAKRSVTLLG